MMVCERREEDASGERENKGAGRRPFCGGRRACRLRGQESEVDGMVPLVPMLEVRARH